MRPLTIALAVAALVGTAPAANAAAVAPERPAFLRGAIRRSHYDGVTTDLLTAGLGRTGLANPSAPSFADPLGPTAAELRRRAVHANYRGLVDTSPGGGYGTLYGPNVRSDGTVTDGEGLIAGDEYLALARDADEEDGTVLMVQVPDSFDRAHVCIVTAPSSGSRGIYGAIGTAGEWGLKRGCAVAYTDKGTGTGAHDLQRDRVNLVTGELVEAEDAGRRVHFDADLSRRCLAASTPRRRTAGRSSTPIRARTPSATGAATCCARSSSFYVLNRRSGSEAQRPGSPPPRRSSSAPASRTAVAPRCAPRSATGAG